MNKVNSLKLFIFVLVFVYFSWLYFPFLQRLALSFWKKEIFLSVSRNFSTKNSIESPEWNFFNSKCDINFFMNLSYENLKTRKFIKKNSKKKSLIFGKFLIWAPDQSEKWPGFSKSQILNPDWTVMNLCDSSRARLIRISLWRKTLTLINLIIETNQP